jgi:hypothetical protein
MADVRVAGQSDAGCREPFAFERIAILKLSDGALWLRMRWPRPFRQKSAGQREVQDGLTELLDLVGAGGEGGQRGEGEAGVVGEGLGVWAVEAGEAGRCQPVARRLPRRRQLVAKRHQLIHLGDDAVLFGRGREGKRQP